MTQTLEGGTSTGAPDSAATVFAANPLATTSTTGVEASGEGSDQPNDEGAEPGASGSTLVISEQEQPLFQVELAATPDPDQETAEADDHDQPAPGFAGFGFSRELLQGLDALGFREPSPIQKAAFPELLLGRDLVGQAQTGTGKTRGASLATVL